MFEKCLFAPHVADVLRDIIIIRNPGVRTNVGVIQYNYIFIFIIVITTPVVAKGRRGGGAWVGRGGARRGALQIGQ